jgi:hypothetical protein
MRMMQSLDEFFSEQCDVSSGLLSCKRRKPKLFSLFCLTKGRYVTEGMHEMVPGTARR